MMRFALDRMFDEHIRQRFFIDCTFALDLRLAKQCDIQAIKWNSDERFCNVVLIIIEKFSAVQYYMFSGSLEAIS